MCHPLISSSLSRAYSIMAASASQIFFFIAIVSVTRYRANAALTVSSPGTFLLPVTKHAGTLQYLTEVRHVGDPPRLLSLVLDLGGPVLWTSHAPSTRYPVPFRSVQCVSASGRRRSGGNTCEVTSDNGVTGLAASAELSVAPVSVDSSDAEPISIVHQLLFALSPASLLSGLAGGAKGMLGLGRSRTALPEQLSILSGGDRRFYLCLGESDGIIAAGGVWPFSSSSPPGGDVSKSMVYAPMLTGESGSSGEYVVVLKSIKVNGDRLSLSSSSSMQLSTVVPYTTMESSIYRAFTGAFAEAAKAMNMTRTATPTSVPFELCFSSGSVMITPAGPAVPEIDLVLQSEMVRWRVQGRNSMVRARDGVICLGVADGGPQQRNGVVLGGYQLEDVLVEFDLGASMVGFSGSLPTSQRRCSDFTSLSLQSGARLE